MVIIKATISKELDQLFREKVLDKYGFRRGALSEALVEAIENWISPNFEMNEAVIDSENMLKKYPGRYLAIKDGEIIINEDTLEKLWDKIPDDKSKIAIITPRMHAKTKYRRQLGWKMKRL